MQGRGRRFDPDQLHHFERRMMNKTFYLFYIVIFALIISFVPIIPIENEVNQSVTVVEYKSVVTMILENYNVKK